LWNFAYPKEAMEVPTIIVFHNSKTMDKSKDASKEWFGHVHVKHFFLFLFCHECLFNYGFTSEIGFMSFIKFESFVDMLVVLFMELV
jgi:hypothetical protein